MFNNHFYRLALFIHDVFVVGSSDVTRDLAKPRAFRRRDMGCLCGTSDKDSSPLNHKAPARSSPHPLGPHVHQRKLWSRPVAGTTPHLRLTKAALLRGGGGGNTSRAVLGTGTVCLGCGNRGCVGGRMDAGRRTDRRMHTDGGTQRYGGQDGGQAHGRTDGWTDGYIYAAGLPRS